MKLSCLPGFAIMTFQVLPCAFALEAGQSGSTLSFLPTAAVVAKEAYTDTRVQDALRLAEQVRQITGKEAVEASRAVGDAEAARHIVLPKVPIAGMGSSGNDPVPNAWSYADNKDRIESGLSDEDRAYLRQYAKDPQSLLKAQMVLEDRRARDKVYDRGSQTATVFAKAAARLLDPLVLGALVISAMLVFFYRRSNREGYGKATKYAMPSAESVQRGSALHEGVRLASTLIVDGYRRKALAAGGGQAPTSKTSDKRLMEIYQTVGTAFQETAVKRGEALHVPYLNYIVLHFLAIEESHGPAFLETHLRYQTEKYLNEGLRQDYRQELHLF